MFLARVMGLHSFWLNYNHGLQAATSIIYIFSLLLKPLTLHLKLYAIIKLDKNHSMSPYTTVQGLSGMQI